MRLLGIEAVTSWQSVALLEDDHVLAEAFTSGEGTRGGRLLPMLDEVLKKAGLAPEKIDAIAVSIGPGSFTGVRVALATAKGLALGTGARLLGISTLEALAAQTSVAGVICPLLDAGRDEVYMGLFERQDTTMRRLLPDSIMRPEAVVSFIASSAYPVHLVGEVAGRYRDCLIAGLGAQALLTEQALQAIPTAASVARLAAGRLAANPYGDEASEVVPVYLRRAEAELNWEKGLIRSPLAKLSKAIH
jgi:tRNA threonylcarbamoyladenosine biosynthesis protein TsaB